MTPKERTPEERKAISAKGVATRQRNIREREAQRLLDIERRDVLKCEIKELELKRGILERHELSNKTALTLTNKVLLSEAEIVSAANPWELATGIYFLIYGDKVIYVGQSVNVYARISQHHDKLFDSFAFIPCEKNLLDSLESLYIHVLRPSLNGNMHGGKQAPLSLNKLIGVFGIKEEIT
jgi:hypothetical protein